MIKNPSSTTFIEQPDSPPALPAIDTLYERYRLLVLRTAYLLLADWAEAEDVAQEVWITVGRRLDTYRPELGAMSTWLHQITVNRCLNVRRRLKRWLPLNQSEWQERHASDPLPLETVLRSEEGQRVWAGVQQLPLKQRAVIVLRYYHDLSYEDIATVLQCPLGTVRSRLHTAHKHLRSVLESES